MPLSVELPAEPASVREARRFVSTALDDGVDPADVEMLVSEVVSNAVLHARTPFVVTVIDEDARVRVEVRDGNPDLPRPRHPDPTAVTGRGLLIVAAIASRWGVEPLARGKTVWFEIDRGAAEALA